MTPANVRRDPLSVNGGKVPTGSSEGAIYPPAGGSKPAVVIAAEHMCPTRTVRRRTPSGGYACDCCGTRLRYEDLGEPWPIEED